MESLSNITKSSEKRNAVSSKKKPSSFFKPVVQAKLAINSPNDIHEQEADAVADKVMRMNDADIGQATFFQPATPSISRKCDHCEEEEKKMQRKEMNEAEMTATDSFEKYVDNLSNGGQSLPGEVRSFYEPRLGHDFSQVKVHTDTVAAKSAQSINALAYTSGNNIVFNNGQYSPHTDSGKRLLGHELTHVVQQGKGIQAKKIQRAVVTVNNQTITVDYSNIIFETNFLTGSQSQITTFTGAAPVPAVMTRITALPVAARRWLFFALDLLNDNTTAAHASLNRTDAVDRLITFASTATTDPLAGSLATTQQFARDVLIFSGWTDVALTTGLTAPNAAAQAVISPIINPPATGGAAPGPLKPAILKARLVPALTKLLKAIDPALRTTVKRQSMADIRAVGDLILAEARDFFTPWSDAARVNVFNLTPTWTASGNISDTTAQVTTKADRINYLENRAQIVGWNNTPSVEIPDTNIFADSEFDGRRVPDQTELSNIITTMEADPVIQPILDRLLLHTGFQTGTGRTTRIGIDPEFDAAVKTECAARWKTIGTLCHEVLHALSHPDFDNAATGISFDQVVMEGFTEVLGQQLFNDRVRPKAATNAAFKTSLEVGIAASPCPPVVAGKIGYKPAGPGAETIRTKVGDNNFRAAYFLGRPDLVGI